jgi:hypothetical protein
MPVTVRPTRTDKEIGDFAIRTASPDARRVDGAAALQLRTTIRFCRALWPDVRLGLTARNLQFGAAFVP